MVVEIKKSFMLSNFRQRIRITEFYTLFYKNYFYKIYILDDKIASILPKRERDLKNCWKYDQKITEPAAAAANYDGEQFSSMFNKK